MILPPLVLVVIAAVLWTRSGTTGMTQVPAHVVRYSNWTRPTRVTFAYPLPDGSTGQATRFVGLFCPVPGRRLAMVRPGDAFSVYVDPSAPGDPRLDRSSSATTAVAGMLILLALVMARLLG